MSICTGCMYIDCTKENEEVCRDCYDGEKYTPRPHAMGHEGDNLDALIEGLKLISYMEVKDIISEYKWRQKFNIEKVIFNNPATIVFWEDGTKTVVKRQKGDRWDKEKGLAMAIAKKLYGNTGKYCDILKEHLEG